MNLVLNAAFPLTATYTTERRLERVQRLKDDGTPDVTDTGLGKRVATEEAPVDVRVVDTRLDEKGQRARELAVIAALAECVRSLGAIDARLATRYHGTVDLTTYIPEA